MRPRSGPLLDQIDGPVGRVSADGAYDRDPTYQIIAAHGDGIEAVIPPRSTAGLVVTLIHRHSVIVIWR